MITLRLSLLAALLVGCAGVSGLPDVTSATSGLSGQVLLGPTCPGPSRVEGDPACADRPYRAEINVLRAGQLVARLGSDAVGEFRVGLRPGSYTLVPLTPPGAVLPVAARQSVEVRPDTFAGVVIRYDSGLR